MIPSFVKEREKNGEGFDLYFAGTQCKECEEWMLAHKGNRLQSQLNDRKNIAVWCERAEGAKLFIDSGAFTAHTLGKELDVDAYIEYLNSIDEHVHCFAQVDHIPGKFRQPKTKEELLEAPKLSWDNYLYMKDKVKSKHKLLPIFHQGESWKWLENMLQYTDDDGHIQYIGISPANDVHTAAKETFIERCFSIISKSDNPNVKTHAFGMTSLPLLEKYPFYSADSTGWIMVGAMGNIMTPWGLVDVSDKNKYSKGHIGNMSVEATELVFKWLKDNDIEPEKVFVDYKVRMMVNLIYLTQWMKSYKFKGTDCYKKSLF